ncbi:MAG: molybdopterin-guanine dinucleotide biosynthesis protein MobB [Pseudomonadota bacterium]
MKSDMSRLAAIAENVQQYKNTKRTSTSPIEAKRVLKAKAAYTTRRVPISEAVHLIKGEVVPAPGDLLLARVDRLGQHKRIELGNGRRAPLFPGDEIVLCYGHRYAPDQFEGEVPGSLEPCHMVAAGGIAASAISKHASRRAATRITPLGLLGDAHGRPINLTDHALEPARPDTPLPLTIATVGTSMNAGKTTTAAHLIKGLVNAGLKVGAAKLTGTGAGGDSWLMMDAGADLVLDFTDAGFASTHRVPLRELEGILTTLTTHLQRAGAEAIVVEVADGLFQKETSALLCSPVFRQAINGIIFAAGDAMGAATGVNWLYDHDLPVLAISGKLTAAPLVVRETQGATGLPVMDIEQLSDPGIAGTIQQYLENHRRSRQAG